MSFFKGRVTKGKLGLVELLGVGSTSKQKASEKFKFRNIVNNCESFSKKNELFCFKGFVDGRSCFIKVDTGSDVSLVSSRLIRSCSRHIPYYNSFDLRYPTGEKVPIEARILVNIKLGKFSVELPVFVVDMQEDCLVGTDFLLLTNSENVFNPIFEHFVSDKIQRETCARIDNCFNGIPQFLLELFDREAENLEKEQKSLFAQFLIDFQDVFSEELIAGNCDDIQHKIDVGDSFPIKQTPRRIPFHLQEEVDKILEDMKNKGVIEESKSPWISPAVLVKKKDGSIRFCVDYRKLNSVTKKDSYPIPRIDDMLDRLSGNSWFSSLDLKSGYWQVKMHPEDKEKTAFSIRNGLWQFTVMPFGLCNAPATFERLMEKILHKLLFEICLVYLDDIIIFGKSFEEMLKRLKQVFLCLRSSNLKVNPKKCFFFKKEIKYLGYLVSEKGIATDQEKISAVRDWPVPRTKKQLRSFLGFCSYYRKFVRGFSLIAKPLFCLTENLSKFVWTDQCEIAFNELKERLMSSPILSFPNKEGQFILDTDASDHGIGAVLSQSQEGTEKVIAYFSRVLNKAERNYCVTRRELLAIVVSLKFFHHYLYGRKFVIRTDHISLRWLMSFKNPEGQLARWLEWIQQYDFEIIHRKGNLHKNADSLSRRPCLESNCSYCMKNEVKENVIARIVFGSENLEDWRQKQLQDPIISIFLRAKEMGSHFLRQELNLQDISAKIYSSYWDALILKNGVLFKKWESPNLKSVIFQIIVPKESVNRILEVAHDSAAGGHFGVNKTLANIRKRFYWATCKQDVEDWCRSCKVCIAKKGPIGKGKSPLQIFNVGIPFERVQMDILGPLPVSSKGNQFLLVVIDCFTKWVEVFPLKNIRALTIAEIFVNQVVSRHGIPLEVHTDQGKNFESKIFQEVMRLLGIKKTRTTALHPQSDGQVERHHQTIINYLSKFISEKQKDWDEWINMYLLAYRSSKHEATGVSPAELYFARDLRVPLDLLRGRPPDQKEEISVGSYILKLRKKLEEIHNFSRQRLNLQSLRAKIRYDLKARQIHFCVGQKVWFYNPHRIKGRAPKLQNNWEGPFEIVRKFSEVVFGIRKSSRHKIKVIHADRLAPFLERKQF